jgi:predicted GNAT family acetyltransferase
MNGEAEAASPRDVRIVDNAELRRYEARLGERVAGFTEYRPAAGRRILVHTEVDQAFEGRGIGSRLAAGIFEDIRSSGMKATIHCPFIKRYLARHHEYDDLIASPR